MTFRANVALNNIVNIYNWPTDPTTGVPSQSTGLSNPSTDMDPNNNGFVSDNYYDPNKVLYQLSKYVTWCNQYTKYSLNLIVI